MLISITKVVRPSGLFEAFNISHQRWVQFTDHILGLGFKRQIDNLAFQTTTTDKFKTYFHDIIQNLGFRKGLLFQKRTKKLGPGQKCWSPIPFLLESFDNIDITGSY